jgi:hypothetical protein
LHRGIPFGRVHTSSGKRLRYLCRVCPSVCAVLVYQRRSHTGRIFVKFDIGEFLRKYVQSSRFSSDWVTVSGALHEDLSMLCIVFCRVGKQSYRLGSGCSGAFVSVAQGACWLRCVCPSLPLPTYVCPHVSARLPLDRFSWNLMLGSSTKIYLRTSYLVKIIQKLRSLHLRSQMCFMFIS